MLNLGATACSLSAAVSGTVRVAIQGNVVHQGSLSVADAGFEQINDALFAGVLDLLQAADGDRDRRLGVVELRRGEDVARRDVQHFVAGIALERAVLGVFHLLNDGATAADGLDLAFGLQAPQEGVVLGPILSGLAPVVLGSLSEAPYGFP